MRIRSLRALGDRRHDLLRRGSTVAVMGLKEVLGRKDLTSSCITDSDVKM